MNSAWIRGIAHDFRNLIQTTRGNLEFLQERESPDIAGHLHRALHGLEEMTALANRLETSCHPLPVSWPEAVALIEATVRTGIGGRAVMFAIQGPIPSVRLAVDLGELRRVFLNLTWNACDAMAGRGRITLRCYLDSAFPHMLTVEFRDTGPGIRPEHLPHIFEPSYTTKPGGHGLGLATVRMIMECHRGTIAVDLNAGPGAAFTLRLPVIEAFAD